MLDFIQIVGIMAGILTTTSFVPQVIRSFKTKSTKDISYPMYICLILGQVLWIVYGISLSQMPIILANAIAMFLESLILFSKLKYG